MKEAKSVIKASAISRLALHPHDTVQRSNAQLTKGRAGRRGEESERWARGGVRCLVRRVTTIFPLFNVCVVFNYIEGKPLLYKPSYWTSLCCQSAQGMEMPLSSCPIYTYHEVLPKDAYLTTGLLPGLSGFLPQLKSWQIIK